MECIAGLVILIALLLAIVKIQGQQVAWFVPQRSQVDPPRVQHGFRQRENILGFIDRLGPEVLPAGKITASWCWQRICGIDFTVFHLNAGRIDIRATEIHGIFSALPLCVQIDVGIIAKQAVGSGVAGRVNCALAVASGVPARQGVACALEGRGRQQQIAALGDMLAGLNRVRGLVAVVDHGVFPLLPLGVQFDIQLAAGDLIRIGVDELAGVNLLLVLKDPVEAHAVDAGVPSVEGIAVLPNDLLDQLAAVGIGERLDYVLRRIVSGMEAEGNRDGVPPGRQRQITGHAVDVRPVGVIIPVQVLPVDKAVAGAGEAVGA